MRMDSKVHVTIKHIHSAEGEGFEPSVQAFAGLRVSTAARSATLPTLPSTRFARSGRAGKSQAEGEGLEPPKAVKPTAVFETAALPVRLTLRSLIQIPMNHYS